jgi:hypothetical protein
MSFERVQADRPLGIRRVDDDGSVTQIGVSMPFLGGQELQDVRRRFAMQIDMDESQIRLDILCAQRSQERGLARPGLAEDDQVFSPLGVGQDKGSM